MNARAATVLLAASVFGPAFGLGGCGDDGGDSAGTAGTSGSGSATVGPGTAESGTSSPGSATGSGSDDATGDPTADSTGASTQGPPSDSSDGTTGPGVVSIDLLNDAWADAGAVIFQGGFVMGECWGSTFVPEAEHYPLEIVGARMVVGGEDGGSADFSIAIWSVDETGLPLEELSVGSANVNGDDDALDTVPLDIIGVQVPPITEGEFALVACLTGHSGFPAIAADADGLTHADRNWIRLEDGTWMNAADLGVSGDFIMRATIVPQAM